MAEGRQQAPAKEKHDALYLFVGWSHARQSIRCPQLALRLADAINAPPVAPVAGHVPRQEVSPIESLTKCCKHMLVFGCNGQDMSDATEICM